MLHLTSIHGQGGLVVTGRDVGTPLTSSIHNFANGCVPPSSAQSARVLATCRR